MARNNRKAPVDRWLPRSPKQRKLIAERLRCAADHVSGTFLWHDTTKGVEYWDSIHTRLLRMAMTAEGKSEVQK